MKTRSDFTGTAPVAIHFARARLGRSSRSATACAGTSIHFARARIGWPAAARLLAVLLLGVCAAAAGAEARRSPRAQAPVSGSNITAVVLDFCVVPRVVERRDPCTRKLEWNEKPVQAEKDVRGWWFGSQDIYYNPNIGRVAADIVSSALMESGALNMHSREDLKYYYADKRDALRAKLKLSSKQLDRALLMLDPVKIGRELGLDKVIAGKICDSETRHSRAFGYFASAVSFNVTVYDVASGKAEYARDFRGIMGLGSQSLTIEENAKELAAELKQRYGRR